MKKTVKEIRKEGFDKFYTKPKIAERCIETVGKYFSWSEWNLIIEPSAGNGSFYKNIPTSNKIGLDIMPEHKDIKQQDFFTYLPPKDKNKILVIGNPPFGRISSLAIKFFNHASEFANVIAFIIPRTFRRISVQNKLNLYFHLIHDEEIPTEPCSFTPAMSVKCCFQIWQKKESARSLIDLPITHEDWLFLPFGENDEHGQPTPQ